jgi:hypothetical protein
MEHILHSMEEMIRGATFLAWIVYRMQSILHHQVLQRRKAQSDGRVWAKDMQKKLFERKMAMSELPVLDRAARWRRSKIQEEYRLYVKDLNRLAQNRSQLLHVYDSLGFAAILDPSFTPTIHKNDREKTAGYLAHVTRELDKIERDEPTVYHTREQRSRHAEQIIKFISEHLGDRAVSEYVSRFSVIQRPLIDPYL